MKVKLDGEEVEIGRRRAKVGVILRLLCINPEVALVLKNGRLVTEDEEIREEDDCLILRTVVLR